MCVRDWPTEAACALGFCGWIGEGLVSVGDVEEFFANACWQADRLLGETAACRFFLHFFDENPRQQMIAELLPEVESAIRQREESQ